MNPSIRSGGRALALAALLLTSSSWIALAQRPTISPARTTTKRPDEFGTQNYTVTVIQAGSFTADTPMETNFGNLVRDFGTDFEDVFPGHFYFGVSVPAGVVIDFVGLRASDFFGGTNVATLFSVDRYSGTTNPVISVPSSPHPGSAGFALATDYNAVPLGFLWAQNAHNTLVLDVHLPGGTWPEHVAGLQWVEIWWKRAVSPAPETPSFADVPITDFGYQYVEALKASGITGGCGDGTTFCPDASLTRRQMAIFLAKALGLHWPN